VTPHENVSVQNSAAASQIPPLIKVTGVFDPARIRALDPLSRVPLGDYQPVAAAPATAASRRALHRGDLLPSQNLGGLVSQPVNLVTTLRALPVLENTLLFAGVHTADPISVIRVRVAGVTGPGALSRERINLVGQQIAQRTGLVVDIVAGSSPSPVTIDMPPDKFGQPPLTLAENWVKEGVAVAIISAVDNGSEQPGPAPTDRGEHPQFAPPPADRGGRGVVRGESLPRHQQQHFAIPFRQAGQRPPKHAVAQLRGEFSPWRRRRETIDQGRATMLTAAGVSQHVAGARQQPGHRLRWNLLQPAPGDHKHLAEHIVGSRRVSAPACIRQHDRRVRSKQRLQPCSALIVVHTTLFPATNQIPHPRPEHDAPRPEQQRQTS
jgi:hypothetical protein